MKRVIKFLVIVLVLLMLTSSAFGAGIVLGQVGMGTELASAAPAAEGEVDFDTFWQAWDIVQEEFIDREALEETDLEYGAIRGMLEALGDLSLIHISEPTRPRRQSRIPSSA